MAVDQKWLAFLRDQFPEGSRIRLREMKDPFHPVEPGTMGTLDHIDDIGTFHVRWDNGRGLGLVLGEDRFEILPPEPTLLKLYMPITLSYHERNEYGDLEEDAVTLDSREAVPYADHITAAMLRERRPEEAVRGIMEYYHGEDESINDKVQSCQFTAEVRNGRLWGVAECRVVGALTAEELDALTEYISGQASDGWGESFEQHPIRADDGMELYAHLWQSGNGWSIQTEQRRFHPEVTNSLPDLCLSTLPGMGSLIVIKRGEMGYYRSDWDTGDAGQNRRLADYHNQQRGITKAQEEAMACGSMHGWDCPGADPKTYEQSHQEEPAPSPELGGMDLG